MKYGAISVKYIWSIENSDVGFLKCNVMSAAWLTVERGKKPDNCSNSASKCKAVLQLINILRKPF
jgi:hypothetical protein